MPTAAGQSYSSAQLGSAGQHRELFAFSSPISQLLGGVEFPLEKCRRICSVVSNMLCYLEYLGVVHVSNQDIKINYEPHLVISTQPGPY